MPTALAKGHTLGEESPQRWGPIAKQTLVALYTLDCPLGAHEHGDAHLGEAESMEGEIESPIGFAGEWRIGDDPIELAGIRLQKITDFIPAVIINVRRNNAAILGQNHRHVAFATSRFPDSPTSRPSRFRETLRDNLLHQGPRCPRRSGKKIEGIIRFLP